MASNKIYWKSEAELSPNNSIVDKLRQNEFPEEIPVDQFLGDKEQLESSQTSRRDFLKYVGFSTAAASLAACEGPVHKSIPYVLQPERIVPGVANYYATTIADGFDFANILVKTREGRPIKIERNREAGYLGSTNARVQSSVLSLYDSTRLQGPRSAQGDVEWDTLNAMVKAKLAGIQNSGKKAVFLTQTYASPSTSKLIADFGAAYPGVEHVTFDAIGEDAALNAFAAVYGERALADYDLSKAELIVSFGADFLGDWQGGGYDAGYAKGRVPKAGKMSRHIQFESNMTLSGANADKRVALSPAGQKAALAYVYAGLTGSSQTVKLSEKEVALLDSIIAALKTSGSNAVVLTGLDDQDAQALVLGINQQLESAAFDAAAPKYVRQGDKQAFQSLLSDMKANKVGLLVIDGVDPVYASPAAEDFVTALANVEMSIAFATNQNETTGLCSYVAAASHYLESWGDTQIKKGHFGLTQPVIRELFDTRQFQQCLLDWMGSDQRWLDYIQATWSADILNGGDWNKALHDGVWSHENAVEQQNPAQVANPALNTVDLEAAASRLATAQDSGLSLVLYSKSGMGDGRQAGNPWLQEFPDPISRVSWDNYVTVSRQDAAALGIVNEHVANGGLDGSYVNVTVGNTTISNVPAIIQPGQAKGTIGLSFGYGKKAGLKPEMQIGVNAFALYQDFKREQTVSVAKVSGMHEFACIQLHNTLMGRGDIIKETTLEQYNHGNPEEWNAVPMVSLNHQEVPATTVDLWDSFDRSIGHHFNMSIDLNACTGCGACVIACHAENNVPVVGKREMRLSRDMHWLRIDRYYSSEETFEGDDAKKDAISGVMETKSGFEALESPSDNPQVAFQPVMCQHCNHAPCETVCPVAATAHSRQGHNHMAYNRCVGTRYCANNCPYKVRRFNWFLYNNNDEFDYHMNNDLGKMVLNPDVNVRSRGVMEKCSWCIQMTQKSILDAKRDGRPVADSEFQTACSNACSSGAIVFGDINDPNSEVSALKASNRMYHLLEHVGTKPNVFYQVKVRNTNEA
ncbi:MAG: hypothetical protein RLZZ241_718 [Bacteroidota bacterium]|jgi:molybdopterin-containing oxidoreductase family iron-sulfur binding subunit